MYSATFTNCSHMHSFPGNIVYFILSQKITHRSQMHCTLSMFSCISHSEFSVLTHNIPRMIISQKKEAKVIWWFWNVRQQVMINLQNAASVNDCFVVRVLGRLIVRWQTCELCSTAVSMVLYCSTLYTSPWVGKM